MILLAPFNPVIKYSHTFHEGAIWLETNAGVQYELEIIALFGTPFFLPEMPYVEFKYVEHQTGAHLLRDGGSYWGDIFIEDILHSNHPNSSFTFLRHKL